MTNLELTMGEKKEAKGSSTFEITFKGGIKVILSEENKDQLVKLWENFLVTKKDATVRFADGRIVRASAITNVNPIRQQASDVTMEINMQRINDVLQEIPIKDERKKWWLGKIKENHERIKNNEPWFYYDKKGNEISRERADMIFRRPDAVVVEKGQVVEEVYYKPHIA